MISLKNILKIFTGTWELFKREPSTCVYMSEMYASEWQNMLFSQMSYAINLSTWLYKRQGHSTAIVAL